MAISDLYAGPSDPAARIRQGLIERGLPPHIADGFVMNFADESGFDPGINEQNPTVPGSRGGYGLYQLTGPRRVAYEQYAGQRGLPLDDEGAQLDFMMTELAGPERAASDAIMRAGSAEEAAAAVASRFLRPAPEHLASRVARYAGGQGAAPTGGAPGGPAGGSALGLADLYAASQAPRQQAEEAQVDRQAQERKRREALFSGLPGLYG